MCFPLFPVHVLFWFLVYRAPKRQRIYRAKFFVYFGTIRLYTKFELLMSITFFRNPLFEMKRSDGGVPSVCAPCRLASVRTQRITARQRTHTSSRAQLGLERANVHRPASLSYSDWRWFAAVVTFNDSPRLVASA